MHPVVQDRHHQLPVVSENRALASIERARFCPPETDSNAERSRLSGLIDRTRIAGHIQARNADRASRAADFLQRVQHRGGLLLSGFLAVSVSFEPDAVHGG